MRKSLQILAATAGLALLTSPALAQLSGNVAVTSNYVWRGITQSSDDPAVQAGLDYDFGNGFAAGAWTSSIDFGDDSPMELDLYASYTHEFYKGFSVSVGGIGYIYPGQDNASPDFDFFEGWVGLTRDFGSIAVSGKIYYSPDNLGSSTWYYTAGVTLPIVDWLSASANIGHYDWENTGIDTTDWNIGLAATWGRFTASLVYSDTDVSSIGDDVIVTLLFKFP